MYLDECLEQLGTMPVEVYRLARKMRKLDIKIKATAERARKNVLELFGQAAAGMPREEFNARWAVQDEELDELMRYAIKKVDVGAQLKEYLRLNGERLHMEVDRAARLLEEEDPGVIERIRRRADMLMEEGARLARDRLKMRRAQRMKAARRKRLNQIRHRRSSEKANLLLENDQVSESADVLVEQIEEAPLIEPRVLTLLTLLVKPEILDLEPVTQAVAIPKIGGQSTAAAQVPNVEGTSMGKSDQESQTILKLLTEHAESRHGRVRKVSSRVSNGLMFEMRAKELAVRRLGKAAGATPKHGPPSRKGRKSQTVATTSTATAEAADDDENRTWCFCNQPSFGFMVACDSRHCPYEWFHGSCVGVEEEFKGKWYCPHCSKKMEH